MEITAEIEAEAQHQSEQLTLKELVEWLSHQDWSGFAQDLVRFYNERGYLSEKQEMSARSMYAKCVAKDAAKTAQKALSSDDVAVVPIGIHRNVAAEVIKVYKTQRGYLATKRLTSYENYTGETEWKFVYAGKAGLADLSDATLLPVEDARKFGRLTKRCINCLIRLTDERSLAAGYGATCAKHMGWHYPNMAEAMEIIAAEGLELEAGAA